MGSGSENITGEYALLSHELWRWHHMNCVRPAIDRCEPGCQFSPYICPESNPVPLVRNLSRDSTVNLKPRFIPAHLDLVTTLATQGKPDRARAKFDEVLQLDSANNSAKQQIDIIEAALLHSHGSNMADRTMKTVSLPNSRKELRRRFPPEEKF
jgi:hypothetical protein